MKAVVLSFQWRRTILETAFPQCRNSLYHKNQSTARFYSIPENLKFSLKFSSLQFATVNCNQRSNSSLTFRTTYGALRHMLDDL